MKKRLLAAVCLMLTLMVALPSLAAPVMTNGSYTAYLGQDSYLFLQDSQGVTKVLQHPIADLVGMDDARLYCLTQDGKLYAIMLDGSATSIVAANPTQEDLAQVTTQPPYTLDETGALSIIKEDGTAVSIATGVLAASATADALYFIVNDLTGTIILRRVALPLTTILPAQEMVFTLDAKPLSMIATPDAVTILHDNGRVSVYDPINGGLSNFDAAQGASQAMVVDGKLVYFAQEEEALPTVLSVENYSLSPLQVTATPAPTATPRPTATAKPTATPKPTSSSSSSSSSDEDDGRIRKGASGSAVRKMQNRLAALGYPVGKVDGVFGDNTLLAVNLFQCAIGYRERTYASEDMLERLYARSAPSYDPYAALREGDEGTDVKIMQTYLLNLGYDIGEKAIDGKFGKDTKAAVERFQLLAGLKVTGEADAETLKKLFDDENPIKNSTETPTPSPEPAPSDPPADGGNEGETPTDPPADGGNEGETPTNPPADGGNEGETPTDPPADGGDEGETPTNPPADGGDEGETPTNPPADGGNEGETPTNPPADGGNEGETPTNPPADGGDEGDGDVATTTNL